MPCLKAHNYSSKKSSRTKTKQNDNSHGIGKKNLVPQLSYRKLPTWYLSNTYEPQCLSHNTTTCLIRLNLNLGLVFEGWSFFYSNLTFLIMHHHVVIRNTQDFLEFLYIIIKMKKIYSFPPS